MIQVQEQENIDNFYLNLWVHECVILKKGIGSTNSFIGELSGVYDGLWRGHQKGFQVVDLHIDSKAVHWEELNKVGNTLWWSLIHQICNMICFGWRLCISHIHRERNTDAFANLTCELEFEFMMFEQPPDCCNFLGPV